MQRSSYPLRMPDDVREKVERMAKAEDRSINGQLVALVRAGLSVKESQKENAPVVTSN